MIDWLRDPNNATVTQALSAAVQAVFAVALFVTTLVTIWLARRTVDETAKAAAATRDAVQEAIRARDQAREHHAATMAEADRQRQQTHEQLIQDAAPILTFALLPPDEDETSLSWQRFDVGVRNVGRGPSVDLYPGFRDTATGYTIREIPEGAFMPGGRAAEHGVDIHEPLTLASGEKLHLRYARAPPYDPERIKHAEEANDFGLLVAVYSDVFGDRLTSTVRLRAMPMFEGSTEVFGLWIEPLEYQRLGRPRPRNTAS